MGHIGRAHAGVGSRARGAISGAATALAPPRASLPASTDQQIERKQHRSA